MDSLLRRTKLLPGESLASLLERLTQLNYYQRLRVIGWLCEGGANGCGQDSVLRPQQAETFVHLSELTGIEAEQLFAASVHRFAPALSAPGRKKTSLTWLDGQSRQTVTNAIVGLRLRLSSATQFCPVCLSESAYHRLIWTPIPSAVCLEHQCLLIRCCPGCGKRVTMSEVVQKQCSVCEVDLSCASSPLMKEDEPGIVSQRVIQSWLMSGSVPELPPGYALPDQPPNVLLHLLHGFCQSLLACQEDWHRLPPPLLSLPEQVQTKIEPNQSMEPHSAYYLYRAAFQGIANWPQGFYRFLDAYSQRNEAAQASLAPACRLGALWRSLTRKDWRRLDFEFMHQGLIAYLANRHIPLPYAVIDNFKNAPWFSDCSGLWTKEQAGQALGISERISDGFSYGPLEKCLVPESRFRFPLFSRDKVMALKTKWEGGLPLSDAIWWLGLDQDDMVQLVEQGKLKLVDGQDDENPQGWKLERQSLKRFFDAVAGQLIMHEGDFRDLAGLYTTSHVTSVVGIDRLALLQGVADGIVPAYKRTASLPSLLFVYFMDSAVTALPDLIYARRGWISGHAFSQQKGISLRVVHEWVSSGLLEPAASFGHIHYFVARSIEQVFSEHTEEECSKP